MDDSDSHFKHSEAPQVSSSNDGSGGLFLQPASTLDFPNEERKIERFWLENRIFHRSVDERKGLPGFVFYEGPPTANGLPHNGHVLTRAIKDIFPRYKTMRGYYVSRKAGWDTHGLPVEVEVEKELHIHGKAAIETYGVELFVKKCINSVFRYTTEWEELTSRIGFWVDLKDAYVTYHKSYVESVWWALSELYKKGLLYLGHKVVWWWAQGGTGLSSAEVGQGYKTVEDPSVYVSFPLRSPLDGHEDVAFLIWTTTPWTLPSNMYVAINAAYIYLLVSFEDDDKDSVFSRQKFLVAESLLTELQKKFKKNAKIVAQYEGRALIGLAYEPPFDLYQKEAEAHSGSPVHHSIEADFVSLDTGTGLVHMAPAFGEEDHLVHRKLLVKYPYLPLFCAVKPDGCFISDFVPYAGRWVKDCDKDLQKDLREKKKLVHSEWLRHEYPFCWRSDTDPLIQYARPAWYVRTTAVIDKVLENNQGIEWLPPHIKDGRFGDFLKNNVDWALSRERYWGTPLNIWINDVSKKVECPASIKEILDKNPNAFDHFFEAKSRDPELSDHLMVHKPWIDSVTWKNLGEEGVYRRVPDVIDCWFDSGCMPFAQWGYPHTGANEFSKHFPADFITEAIDQTRGWFYSLLMISTLLFGRSPYKTCIVLGHVSDREGKKESKSKGNYTPPSIILDMVAMDFAVWALPQNRASELNVASGTAYIAREDLEGLDLKEDGLVDVCSLGFASADGGQPPKKEMVLKVGKKLPRRVVLLCESDMRDLGVRPTQRGDVTPVEVLGLPIDERVSIRDKGVPSPGADAFRWFFYASNPPWNSTRHSLSNVRALQKESLIKLRNIESFFSIYANLDGFDPRKAKSLDLKFSDYQEIDRWIQSELGLMVKGVTAHLDGFDIYPATCKISDFIESLSNWYVRRSRERFWRAKDEKDIDKFCAYITLYKCLVNLTKVLAPFTPYTSERMYQSLVRSVAPHEADSVHLCAWPNGDEFHIDVELSHRMATVRELVSLGLQARTQAKVKVRQPFATAYVVVFGQEAREQLLPYSELICEELNVMNLDFVEEVRQHEFVRYKLKPNFRSLGSRGLGKEAQTLMKLMGEWSFEKTSSVLFEMLHKSSIFIDGVSLSRDDVDVVYETRAGFFAAGGKPGVVILDTRLDDELKDMGLFRELQSRVQTERKNLSLGFSDRIELHICGSKRVKEVAQKYKGKLAKEVLAKSIEILADEWTHETKLQFDGEWLQLVLLKI